MGREVEAGQAGEAVVGGAQGLHAGGSLRRRAAGRPGTAVRTRRAPAASNLTPTSPSAPGGREPRHGHVRRPGVRPVRRLRRRRGRARPGTPSPTLAEKRRDTPGAPRAHHVARRPARGHRRRAGLDRLPLRGLLAHPARRQDLHLDRLRRHHRHGHGPHDPGHGRPRAPDATATWSPTPSARSRWRAGSPSSSGRSSTS